MLELIGGDDFVNTYAMVPSDVVSGQHPYTLFNSMFLHTGWEHIIGNMVFLWAFGPEVEDAMSGIRFFVITYPRDQIKSLLVIGWYARVTLVPALAFIGVWFVSQLFSEVGTIAGAQSDGVAYAAHIGGVVFGATTARLFEAGSRGNRLEFQHGSATVR